MNRNRQKHKLLKILSKQYILGWQSKKEPVGLTKNVITKELSISDFQLKLLITDLCQNDEAQHYKPDEDEGWAATKKGVSSFNNKKYELLNRKKIWDSIKNWVQTLIPVLSLIITILVILKDDKATNKELLELKERIEYIELQESKPLVPSKIFLNQNIETDSLKIE